MSCRKRSNSPHTGPWEPKHILWLPCVKACALFFIHSNLKGAGRSCGERKHNGSNESCQKSKIIEVQGTCSRERVEEDFECSPQSYSLHKSQTLYSQPQEASGQPVSPELLITLNYQLHVPQFKSTRTCTREACCLRIVLKVMPVLKTSVIWIHKRCWLFVALTQNDWTHFVWNFASYYFVHTFPLGFAFPLALIWRIPSKRFTEMFFHRGQARCKKYFKSCFRLLFKV